MKATSFLLIDLHAARCSGCVHHEPTPQYGELAPDAFTAPALTQPATGSPS